MTRGAIGSQEMTLNFSPISSVQDAIELQKTADVRSWEISCLQERRQFVAQLSACRHPDRLCLWRGLRHWQSKALRLSCRRKHSPELKRPRLARLNKPPAAAPLYR